ncbi:uncharacterized protein FIBRA_00715 [Fibroporia radiculosa]|uniref:Uncharacterized protein n=1 Tax=Fibroporia radiculosa TaxID=599839 RepID=J4I833_9APHY|nr:uncharacterized protein FIBRA_00715 [Fibroporia radiculosa]CCL98711.1 predicted protein [Fibroporia radiculosa]
MLGPPSAAAGPSRQCESNSSQNLTPTQEVPAASTFGVFQYEPLPNPSPIPFQSRGHHASSVQSAQSSSNVNVEPAPSSYHPTPSASGMFDYSHYVPFNHTSNGWGDGLPVVSPGTYQYTQGVSHSAPGAYRAQIPQTLQNVQRSQPSPPPPPFHKQWDAVIRNFLSSAGLTQSARGFDADMVVMNSEWEQKRIPVALGELMKELHRLTENDVKQTNSGTDNNHPVERSLEERKLEYAHFADGVEPRSQTSVIKSVSEFLARNRARNDASNRVEFLQSLAEKKRRLDTSNDSNLQPEIASCARTDAKTQNRDIQMKYDIAKNEDGPLRRTMKSEFPKDVNEAHRQEHGSGGCIDVEQYPALDERIRNIESHAAIRYVPSPPKSLLDRLRFLEDHIVRLEKEYPPWAALHFNQPKRGWPPPPRATPLIVPSHLTSSTADDLPPADAPPLPGSHVSFAASSTVEATGKGKGKSGRTPKSSLHRAVMEKLEVQKAMHDIAGISNEGNT